MCLFDTDEVVRTMAEAMGLGEGPAGCKSSVEEKKNALSPTGSYKGGKGSAGLRRDGIWESKIQRRERRRKRTSPNSSPDLRSLQVLPPPKHHPALTPAIWPCSFSSVSSSILCFFSSSPQGPAEYLS